MSGAWRSSGHRKRRWLACKQVLTGFLVDQWGPTAEAIRAQVVYGHGLFTDLPGIAHSLNAAAARHDGIDFDTEAFGEFPTSSATRISPFAVPTHVEAVPMQVEVASPDQECPAWWREKPQGRHALLLGDPEDGGIAYCGTLPELEAFVTRAQAALHQAKLRQQAGTDASDTPPPQPYTVIGGWDHEYDEPMPIGVIAGHHQLDRPRARASSRGCGSPPFTPPTRTTPRTSPWTRSPPKEQLALTTRALRWPHRQRVVRACRTLACSTRISP
jgi:hypothetical protein